MPSPPTYPAFFQKRGTRFKALFALGMVCFFWGTTWLASKEGVRHMPALQMAGIRQSIGGILYIIYFLSKGRALPRGKEWGPIIILSLLNFGFTNGLTTWGVQYISAGLGAIIAATFPFWIVVIQLINGKRKPPATAIVGLLLGFTGICVIFYEHLHNFLNPGFRFGILISLAGSWSWAFGTLYTKAQATAFNPYFSLGIQMLISGIALTGVVNATGFTIPYNEIPWQSWTSIGYLAVIGSIMTSVAYLYALQNLPTEQLSIYAYMNPIVAVLLGALIFDERLTVFIAIGGAVTLLGVHTINRAFRTKQGEQKEVPTQDQS